MKGKYIMSLDQGTTSSRTIIFNREGEVVASSQKEFKQIYPRPGWVEHDPMEIWATQSGVSIEAMEIGRIGIDEIVGIGITNQRETTIIWDRKTGEPIYNAIVWQCRRTDSICEDLKKIEGFEDYIKSETGLILDAYFSATKIKWILDNVKGARERAEKGELAFGTVDSWLLWNLTKGRVHKTDYSNASRTMLFNINTLKWDDKILEILDIPRAILPEIGESSSIFAYTDKTIFGAREIPIGGIAGDQQSALFGQACFTKGTAKNTYGTGCFMLMNTGDKPVRSKSGLLTTIAWVLDGKVSYGLEGSIFVGGAVIQWLRDELKVIRTAEESEYYARRVKDSNGVYLVPAFVGLGAPYWDMYARGTIVGLSRDSKIDHIIRASLESIAYQTKDVLMAMEEDSGIEIKELNVDGGAVVNDFLMEFQADILKTPVNRLKMKEATALGVAYLAGLSLGFWDSIDDLPKDRLIDKSFIGEMEDERVDRIYSKWKKAVSRSFDWED